MSIQINTKTDYSFLFSSLNSSSSNNSNSLFGINLADYATIKSGSYGRLLKAYYKQNSADDSTNTTSSLSRTKVDSTVKKELTDIQTYANEVRDSAAALMEKGSKSVFRGEDMEKVYEAVSEFASDYNTLMEKSRDSSSSAVIRYTDSMAYTVEGYEDSLKEIGITIGEDNKLTVNKETFLAADMDKVKTLFNGNMSLSYLVSTKAVAIGNKAYSESNKSNLYTSTGNYSKYSTGHFFNGIV